MEDDPTKAQLVRLEPDDERLYWQDALGVSEARLRAAVQAVSPSAQKVSEYLASH